MIKGLRNTLIVVGGFIVLVGVGLALYIHSQSEDVAAEQQQLDPFYVPSRCQ